MKRSLNEKVKLIHIHPDKVYFQKITESGKDEYEVHFYVGYRKFSEITELFGFPKISDGKEIWIELEPVRLQIILRSVKH